MSRKLVIIASNPGSLINFRWHLIKELNAVGFSIIAVAPEDETVRAKLAVIGVRYLPIKMDRTGNNPFHDIILTIKLFLFLKKEKPEVVFGYTIKPVIYGTLAARLAGIPGIFSMLTGTGYAFSNCNLKSRVIGFIAKNLFRFSLRFNTKLFFQNKDNLATFRDEKLISSQQAVAIINGSGVDVHHFSPAALPENVSYLMVARLLVDKGVREYVDAARMIKKKYPHIIFKLVGWVDSNPNAISENELSEWIESGVIEYLGKLSDVRGAIAESSVYVLPSYGEGTPRTVLEAMAMGRPIITTDVPGCRETVVDNQNGFLVTVRDSNALSDAMEYFIHHPDAISAMGTISRVIAVEKYDVDKVNRHILHEMGIPQLMSEACV